MIQRDWWQPNISTHSFAHTHQPILYLYFSVILCISTALPLYNAQCTIAPNYILIVLFILYCVTLLHIRKESLLFAVQNNTEQRSTTYRGFHTRVLLLCIFQYIVYIIVHYLLFLFIRERDGCFPSKMLDNSEKSIFSSLFFLNRLSFISLLKIMKL